MKSLKGLLAALFFFVAPCLLNAALPEQIPSILWHVLKVTPDDGTLKGTPVNSVIIIANSSPVITPSPDTFKFDGDVYEYQVRATDPDGDSLTYALHESPKGMTIDPSTGIITWNIPPGYTGKSPVTVSATDGQGGKVMQNFVLEIRPE